MIISLDVLPKPPPLPHYLKAAMTRVLLFGTVHEEQGVATPSALLAILESVHPAVIFLEIPPAAFPAYGEGTSSNLESSAARRYREANQVVLVPVDLPTPDDSFFRDWQYLDRRVTATSSTYRRLIDQNTIDIATYGFPYLNSERCQKLWSEVYDAMEAAIQLLSHDSRLPMIYETWRRTNELRDTAILQGIDDYYRRSPFETGVLLVGAAHVQSIIKRARVGRDNGTLSLERGNLH